MSLEAVDWALRKVQGISPTQKLVLICLANHVGPDGTCWPSQSTVSEYSGLSRETINRTLGSLEKQGIILSVQRRDQSGRDLAKTYILNLPKEKGTLTKSSPGETEDQSGVTENHTGGAKLTRGCDGKSHPIESRVSEHRGVTENHRGCDGGSQGGVTEDHTNLSKEESITRTKRLKTNTAHARVRSEEPSSVPIPSSDNKSPVSSPSAEENLFEIPDWLDPKDWNDYIEYRKGIRAPMSPVAQRKAIDELDRLRSEGHDPSRVISQSIINEWKGLFPVKSSRNVQGGPGRPKTKTFAEIRTDNNKKAINDFLKKNGEPPLFEEEGEKKNVIEI